jgi:hypothetical protein
LRSAKDVLFTVDEITIHLPVHIIENVAYDVLLDQPVDITTKSKVKTSQMEVKS